MNTQTNKPVEEMTLEEVRNEIAAMRGWKYNPKIDFQTPAGWQKVLREANGYCDDCGLNPCDCRFKHPVPASLDTVAALMPEGWRITEITTEGMGKWFATATAIERRRGEVNRRYEVGHGPTELLARFRLLLLILREGTK